MSDVGDDDISIRSCLVGGLQSRYYDDIQSALAQLLGQRFACSTPRFKKNNSGAAFGVHQIP